MIAIILLILFNNRITNKTCTGFVDAYFVQSFSGVQPCLNSQPTNKIVLRNIQPIPDQIVPMQTRFFPSQSLINTLNRISVQVRDILIRKILLKHLFNSTYFPPIPTGSNIWRVLPPIIIFQINKIDPLIQMLSCFLATP